MVRSVAERAFVPARHQLAEFGCMMILAGRTIWSALRPPYPYGGELVSQFLFALRLCWFPLLISTVCLCCAAAGLQAANFLTLFGAAIVLVACYYGYNASGGPVGVGRATAKSMVLNLVLVHIIGALGTQIFWGANPRAPIGG